MYGAPANGNIVLVPDDGMMTVIEVLQQDMGAAELKSLPASRGIAYTGPCRADAHRLLIRVEMASIAGWTGTVQERYYRINDARLQVQSAWSTSPLHANQVVRA
jgi:hypothetical protein